MAQFITRAEIEKTITEMQKAVAAMSDASHYICPKCFTVKRVEKKRPDWRDLRCWCDYESGDIEP